MVSIVEVLPADSDATVDLTIERCLDPSALQSFFLYAGAGSGKTHSLVTALTRFNENHGAEFRSLARNVAVITYTNAACIEIQERIQKNPLFSISTVHSFCWSQIKEFNEDIRSWLLTNLPKEIEELQKKEATGRAGTKASRDRLRSIDNKKHRLDWLQMQRRFSYNPNGENFGRASLNHSEVLKITAEFICTKPSMQRILINRYPILLIDESQDTSAVLMDAFFALESAQQGKFSLGLIGDTMQRIFADGKVNLGQNLPDRWLTPKKKLNRRCPRRLIALANDVRAQTDGQIQSSVIGSEQGLVHLFIGSSEIEDKPNLERKIRSEMSRMSEDTGWVEERDGVKQLTLEHAMAARRMGFSAMFIPLYRNSRFSTGTLDGKLPAITLFTRGVAPLLAARANNDAYQVMRILRERKSPLLEPSSLNHVLNEDDPLQPVKNAVEALETLVANDTNVSFSAILNLVAQHRLFAIPESLVSFVETSDQETPVVSEGEELQGENVEQDSGSALIDLREFLESEYGQLRHYDDYVSGKGPFGTHQGVKGLQFDRVMVVMDDTEARGFTFSYDSLFSLKPKPKSSAESAKINEESETRDDRTRRLFYVVCTRAVKSLALVAYTSNPQQLKQSVISQGWFEDTEISLI